MSYRYYGPATPMLFGYDPCRDLPTNHLARFIDEVVETTLGAPRQDQGPGQPGYDPRLCLKVLLYGYSTGIRSSRQLERLCWESLPYLFLTRGDGPSYRTLCRARVDGEALLEEAFLTLFVLAKAAGMKRIGHLVVDSTKIRANASPEAVLCAEEYEAVRAELRRILEEAQQVDEREEKEGRPGEVRVGPELPHLQMRDIVRQVRRQITQQRRARKEVNEASAQRPPDEAEVTSDGSEPTSCSEAVCEPGQVENSTAPAPTAGQWEVTSQMVERLKEALTAIEQAEQEGRAHLCLTDPDARMMYGGRERKVAECHSFEAAVDRGDGLLMVGQSSQESHDNERLEALVKAAREHEPDGLAKVDADSGYYQGDAIGRLIEAGIDTCVPDSNTAGDLHRGRPIGTLQQQMRGKGVFEYDAEADLYRCLAGEELHLTQEREHCGQRVKVYRAVADCRACDNAGQCLVKPTAQHRTIKVGRYQQVLQAARQRFAEAAHQERYRHRGEAVETVFGFLRGALGYNRWLLRGAKRVACEARWFRSAYQLRKVHSRWAEAVGA